LEGWQSRRKWMSMMIIFAPPYTRAVGVDRDAKYFFLLNIQGFFSIRQGSKSRR
jgi:hypothetical protein